MTKHFILIATLLFAMCFYFDFGSPPETQAFDPVTISILAPVALQAAKVLAPHVLKMVRNTLKLTVKAGKHLLYLPLLPWGLVQSTILAPWCFTRGFRNMWTGLCAPFKFGGTMLLLPFAIFGVGI